MVNYDIGILSFWNVPNYGTFAQEYALQRKIEELLSDRDVRQIAHLDQRHYDFYYNPKAYNRRLPLTNKDFWGSFNKANNNDDHEKEIQIKKDLFVSAYMKISHTDYINKRNIDGYHFSNVVLGSDIIWDYTQTPFNHDPLLFGLHFDATRISSYAASFGMAKKTYEIPSYVKKGIKKLKYISVRDENSAEIVERITGTKPDIVLDPVWLWDFSNDSSISFPDESNYILVYGQDFTDPFIKNLVKYAKDNELKTIVLDCNDDNYSWCDVMIKQGDLDPLKWIGYFKGANAVATSTFHGLTFGLVFNKKIAFCKTDFIMKKAKSLLENMGIDGLFDDRDNVEKMLSYSWEYKNINNYIYQEKMKSIDYLLKICREGNEQR